MSNPDRSRVEAARRLDGSRTPSIPQAAGTAALVDNRPAAAAQQSLAQLADNSWRVTQLAAFGDLANQRSDTIGPNVTTQLAKRRSNRIATNSQVRARRQRAQRAGRRNGIVRFVPGAVPQTRLAPVLALGGMNGLHCPIGSYSQRVNNHQYQGSRALDAAALGGNLPGQVWHHHHDFVSTGPNAGTGTMFLLRTAQHRAGHYGGVYQWNQIAGNAAYG